MKTVIVRGALGTSYRHFFMLPGGPETCDHEWKYMIMKHGIRRYAYCKRTETMFVSPMFREDKK